MVPSQVASAASVRSELSLAFQVSETLMKNIKAFLPNSIATKWIILLIATVNVKLTFNDVQHKVP